MSRTRHPPTRRIGAAERAIAVLDTLADGGELGTNEVARRTGMTPSTVSRQLGTLAASGLVERVAASGRYRLGIRLVHLANAVLARLDVREVARPHLVALVEATGETATLSVPGDDDAITVDFVPGSHQIQPVSRLGRPSIAPPIRSSRGELEAIVALQGPSTRFDGGAVEAALPLLLERAEAISRELGWRPA